MRYKGYILQEKMSETKVPLRVFRKKLLEGYKEIDLPPDKEIITNERTGIPFLKTKKNDNGNEFVFCYWE
jgi:KaiC/GvpD/RAD55 family RecA-like ATPase